MKGKFVGLVAVLLFLASYGFPQSIDNTPVADVSLEKLISEAANQTLNYQSEFRNLLALETKTFTDFDKRGNAKKKTIVEANFLVYQSSKNSKYSFELRNVLKVNEKPIPNSQANADSFFAELAKTSTLKSELEKIEKKSSKYDKSFDISGLTLYEGIILSSNLRPFFEFTLLGKEDFQGAEVFAVGYRQVKVSPFISINANSSTTDDANLEFTADIPRELKKFDIFLRGKFLVDAKTYQLWREERELAVMTEQPLPLVQTTFEYRASDYGILVPKQISVVSTRLTRKGSVYSSQKDMQIDFSYSQFKKTETDVKILDDETP